MPDDPRVEVELVFKGQVEALRLRKNDVLVLTLAGGGAAHREIAQRWLEAQFPGRAAVVLLEGAKLGVIRWDDDE